MALSTQNDYGTVLVCGYRRADLLGPLLLRLDDMPIRRIHVSLDGPNCRSRKDVQDCQDLARWFARNSHLRVTTTTHRQNHGAAEHLLRAVDEVLTTDPFVSVIEDDCLPSDAFFKFALRALRSQSDLGRSWLVGGTQFAPPQLFDGDFTRSRYPLIWGWATRSDWWVDARAEIDRIIRSDEAPSLQSQDIGVADRHFWRSGCRRALNGHLDSWAIILAFAMQAADARAILPRATLVTNVGDDPRGTHVKETSVWTRVSVTESIRTFRECTPDSERAVDDWLRSHFYRINFRHIATTRLTHILDKTKRTPNREPLQKRLSRPCGCTTPPEAGD